MAIIKNPLTIVQTGGGENKLPDVLNKTVTTLTAEDLIGTTQIPNYAFQNCLDLTSVEFPSILQTIGYEAFWYCSSLTSVTFGVNSQLTSIGSDAFRGCSRLTSIDIPSRVTTIGSSAFSYCSSLTSITIGENVTTIGSSSFSYCTSLTSITIPSSVTSIGSYAFSGCSRLTTMTILATTPPTLTSTKAISTATTKIYIPAGTLSAYQSATNWSNFADKFEELPA